MEHVVLNFLADNRSHFVDDPELNPEAYAEQFTDAEAGHQEAQQVLARARMIIATELGKDPLLRQEMRTAFKTNAHISVLPTDRGVNKIDEHHTYFVRFCGAMLSMDMLLTLLQNFKYLYQKPALEMLESPQFLHILNAERDLLVTVSISLASDAKEAFEQRLINAFMSDGFSDTARAWNEERARVVREAVDQHLLVNGAKWIREWLREEVEDFLARRCSSVLRKVCSCCCRRFGISVSSVISFSASTCNRTRRRICSQVIHHRSLRCPGARGTTKGTTSQSYSSITRDDCASTRALTTSWTRSIETRCTTYCSAVDQKSSWSVALA